MANKASAKLNNLRQSPRKVRLVADLIRGKTVSRARLELERLTKASAFPLKKLLDSAATNAKSGNNPENLFIKKIVVDEGPILYRRRYRARGRAAPIRKRTSHVSIVLEERLK